MIEILQTIVFFLIVIVGAIYVPLDIVGFFDSSEEDNLYHLSDIDDLDEFEENLPTESKKFLSKEIKKYKEE